MAPLRLLPRCQRYGGLDLCFYSPIEYPHNIAAIEITTWPFDSRLLFTFGVIDLYQVLHYNHNWVSITWLTQKHTLTVCLQYMCTGMSWFISSLVNTRRVTPRTHRNSLNVNTCLALVCHQKGKREKERAITWYPIYCWSRVPAFRNV